jgi:hypothetical protein
MRRILTVSGPSETSIILQTRMCNLVPNTQSHELTSFEVSQYADLDWKYPHAKFRSPPNPVYNCHGLTFASRRTGIHSSSALQAILHDDGYTEVDKENVLPGDTILYYADDGDIEHSGIVVSPPGAQLKIPQVVSKWGKYKEAIHFAHDCPYHFANARYYRVTK